MQGVPLQDVWTDIRLQAGSKERLGYPTQKPEALLERLLMVSTEPGDVVLDPFCGCGTTLSVAQRMDLQWIGIDISPTAIEIMRRRLWNQHRVTPIIVDTPDNEGALRLLKPFEFQNYVINALNGTHSPRKTGDMRRAKYGVGYIVAFSFTRGAVEEVARARQDGLNIRLIRVKELLLMTRRPGNPLAKLGPQPEGDVLPLPPMRQSKDLPTAEQLIQSDRKAVG